jgi:hypothetical protein
MRATAAAHLIRVSADEVNVIAKAFAILLAQEGEINIRAWLAQNQISQLGQRHTLQHVATRHANTPVSKSE